MRMFLLILLFLITLFAVGGCAVTIGNQKLRVRPGTRVPARTVEEGDGEQQYWDEWRPEGNSMFLFVRGQF